MCTHIYVYVYPAEQNISMEIRMKNVNRKEAQYICIYINCTIIYILFKNGSFELYGYI